VTLNDREWPFDASRAISALAELFVYFLAVFEFVVQLKFMSFKYIHC